MSFNNIYRTRFKGIVDDSLRKGLKIGDFVIKDNENLEILGKFFENKQESEKINLVGKIVSEKMLFYRTMSEIAEKSQHLNITKYIIPPNCSTEEEKEPFRQ